MNRLALLLSCFAMVSFADDLFRHDLRNFPKDNLRCDEHAQRLTAKFSRMTQLEVYAANTIAESPDSCSIEIAYLSEKILPIVVTGYRENLASISGTHANRQQCEDDMAAQVQIFQSQTFLNPWVAYCEKANDFNKTYSVHIEGWGESKIKFFASSTVVFDHPLMGWDRAIKEVKSELGTAGFPLSTLSITESNGMSDLVIGFYGTERKYLDSLVFGRHEEKSLCESQISRVKEALRPYSTRILGAFCSTRNYDLYRLQLLSLHEKVDDILRENIDPKIYLSAAVCIAKVKDTEEFYRTTLKKNILMGMCGGTKGRYQISLLELPTPQL